MDSYNLSYPLGFEQQKILSDLVWRCRGINGWGEQELLQQVARRPPPCTLRQMVLLRIVGCTVRLDPAFPQIFRYCF